MKQITPRFVISIFFWSFILIPCSTAETETERNCDKELTLDSLTEENYNISSPGYPEKSYSPGVAYKWCFSAPDDWIISITCNYFVIPKSANCRKNALTVSFGKDDQPRAQCGSRSFTLKSNSNKMIVSLHSSKKSRGGKFSCQVKTEQELSISARAGPELNCDCGYSFPRQNNRPRRIVGGRVPGVNEYPFIVTLTIPAHPERVQCGGAIISPKYILTVTHCINSKSFTPEDAVVVVGEHDFATDNETSATKIIKVKQFISYPFYDEVVRKYDLGLVEVATPISFSERVGPVCLPFLTKDCDFTGRSLKILGWGKQFNAGPRSHVLKLAEMTVQDIHYCGNCCIFRNTSDQSETYVDLWGGTQLCTYQDDVDACTNDSGTPLLYLNPITGRYEAVGLVSYGKGCADGYPGLNTKVAPFLQYIIDKTPGEQYCYATTPPIQCDTL